MGGTGGALESNDIVLLLGSDGEGCRNVRSVIEPLLLDLCRPGRAAPPLPAAPLPFDDVEPLRAIRFVWIFPTGSGDVVCDRSAAAAEAAAREEDDLALLRWRKAAVAATLAFDDVFWSIGFVTC